MKNIIILIFLFCPVFAYSENNRFRVGVSLPLTGALAEYGEAVRNGIELARVEQSESVSGIQFVYEDDGYEPKKAVSAFNKLVDIDHVNMVLVWGNEPALAIAPVAEQRKIPTMAIAQYPMILRL